MNKQNDTQKAGVCMACECPCDMHKEHTHETKSSESGAKKCEMCGHEHKADGSCDCGCK